MNAKVYRLVLLLLLTVVSALAQIAGTNVNMVSGTQWPNGDPFLQRQNEPSIAVSSRNPLHLLGGSNDYRTVDLPGLPAGETGDAWLGVFKSYDGGSTWSSTLHPGCPQNVPQCAGAPVLKGFAAGADPVVRTGANGMFYYAGIAFTRTSPQKSQVFLSRFIDNNNEENGDPIKYIGTSVVTTGDVNSFVDKPWLAVDIPRTGAGKCTIASPLPSGGTATQTFPSGNIYVSFTTFAGDSKPPSQIQFVRSADCGATWSKPLTLSDANVNQGSTIAIDPASGAVYVAWRRFQTKDLFDAILVAKSTDSGQTFSAPAVIGAINPFDQGTTDFSFRTNAYPTMAVDGTGRVYVAWSERATGGPQSGGDARIVLSTSKDGQRWSQRLPVNDYAGRGHQFMPAMTFGGGKLMVVFYDLRNDATTGLFTPLGQGQYSETRAPAGDLATNPPRPEKVFTPFVLDAAPADLNEGGLLRRHTLDIWGAQAEPADAPYFNATRVSQYVFGSLPGSSQIEQLQVNPPNFPLFSQGTVPFAGDYLDVAASPAIVPGPVAGTWKFNTDSSPSIVFHAVWADNRDVNPPADGDWTHYTPPVSSSTGGLSIFDPTQGQPSCITGQAGMRNENIYTSRISQGLVIATPSNSKVLGTIQRSFPLAVYNQTNVTKTYRLSIQNQPPGGKASFLQFPAEGFNDPLTDLDVQVAPISSISRMVYVTSTDPAAPVHVSVSEISGPGAQSLLPGGLQGSTVLNPDPLNPANPAIANTELFNPAIANPAIANPAIANPAIANPAIANPAIANPAIANPAIANLSTSNAAIANPAIANPAIANPAIANPAIANTAITDANWAITNKGNATGSYSIHIISNVALPRRIIPQLILNKTYNTPVVVGCNLQEQPQTVVVTNISNPKITPKQQLTQTTLGKILAAALRGGPKAIAKPHDTTPPGGSAANTDITDSSLDDATVTVGPGETLYVTLRFFNTDSTQPLGFDPGTDITIVIISQAVDTGDSGSSIAASHLFAATSSLPATAVGASYDTQLLSAGGNSPFTWTLLSGSLPPGLTLTSSGEIKGQVGGPGGTYRFTVQVSDSSNPAQPPSQETLQIQVSSVALAIAKLAAVGPNGVTSVKSGDTITVTALVADSGSAASAVMPSISVAATGSATASCGAPNPLSSNISQGGGQIFTFTCGSVSGTGTLTFAVSLTATDSVLGATLTVSPATSNTITLLGAPPALVASATTGGSSYTAGTWTNQPVIVSFTCTTASGAPSTKQVTVTSPGANQTVTTNCTDSAGNTTNASFSGIDIDLTPPTITYAATLNGQPYFGTPTNQSVVITFSCTDSGGSGVASFSQPVTVAPPAANQTVTGTCSDLAGNISTVVSGPVNSNATPPTLTAGYGGYVPGTWTSQAVTVVFNCAPATGISILSVTPATTVTVQGANQFVAGRCTDSAGNVSQLNAGPINIETAQPTISLVSIPTPVGGWYRTPVTISWLCTDPIAGQSTINRTVSTDGANQTVTATCTNLAGASVSASRTVSVDTTPPVIAGSASPAAGNNGWNTSPVVTSFSCQDALSGVATGYPQGGATITGDTNGTTVNGTCRDVAGNTSTATLGPIRIDRTPPILQVQSISPINGAGWSNGPVTVTWACEDSGSGPATPTVTATVSGDGTNRSAAASCQDVAGNSVSATQSNIKIDTVAPFINFTSPANNGSYTLNQQVVVNFTCFDTGSGMSSCSGSGGSNTQVIRMSTPGSGSFTVTGVDLAGNTTTVTHTYNVHQ